MYIVIICFPVYDVINFEIDFCFLINPLFYMTKKSGQKFECRKNKKSFLSEINKFFIISKGLSVAMNVSDMRVGF